MRTELLPRYSSSHTRKKDWISCSLPSIVPSRSEERESARARERESERARERESERERECERERESESERERESESVCERVRERERMCVWRWILDEVRARGFGCRCRVLGIGFRD